MFKQQETKNKDEGFVDEKGKALTQEPVKAKEEKNPNDINLETEFKYNDKKLEDIEIARLAFNKKVKKGNIFKWIAATIAIAMLIMAVAWLMPNETQALKIVGYCLIGASVLIMVAYYVLAKKYNDKHMKVYLKRYYGDINAYVFGQECFSDVNGIVDGKIANFDFNNSSLYKNVSTIGSRNIVNFKIDGKYDCRLCDCAAQMTTTRKLEPLFIGKYLIAPNTYQGDQPIIIYLTGNSRALPPNNVDYLPKVINTEKMIVYSNNKEYGSILNEHLRALVSSLTTNNVLVDVSISITKGTTYFCLGYDDCLMVLPFQQKFNPLPVYKFKKDLVVIADIIANLNNK